MISVYDIGNEAYEKNGNAILMPQSCILKEEAGGSYEVSLNHPIDPEGRWKHLVPGAIVKAPGPVATIQGGAAGQEFDVYKVTGATDLQEKPRDAWEPVYYPLWAYGSGYAVGSKVTYSNQNYQCIYWDGESPQMLVPPPANSWWKSIPNVISTGVATLAQLKTGTEVYELEDTSSDWKMVMLTTGIQGYVRTNRLQYDRHERVEPKPEKTVSDQLFRIYSVNVDTKSHEVSVNARHVSYDLSGILIGDCDIKLAGPSVAITRMRSAWMMEYRGEVATNLTTEENGTYTGNPTGKNAIYGLLDPDKGLVPYFRAQLFRDNWDLYVMKNDRKDRGVRLTYGKNLKGVSWSRKSDSLVTRVVPVAKDAEGADLYLPEKWVDSPNIGDYPVVIMERLKVDGQVGKEKGNGDTEKWTLETLQAQMRTKAGERFSVDHADGINVSLTVDFTLLGDTEEYKEYRGLEKLYMYDQVTVQDTNVGLDLKLQVSSIEWDAILQRYRAIKLGDVFDYGGRTVSGYQIGDGAILYEKISQETIDRIIKEVG